MIKRVFIFFLTMATFNSGFTQIRTDKLEINPREKFEIFETDILVSDTLIMGDSSVILLNNKIKDNYIHTKVAIIGKGCLIIGRGENGENGQVGENGFHTTAPCRDGGQGKEGKRGEVGKAGKNIFLYATTIDIRGSLTINVNGGDGGDGGRGGNGGDGGGGTRVCAGGSGGNGGNGAGGGNGGAGGHVIIQCSQCFDLHMTLNERLFINNFGGLSGLGGLGGLGGQAGLGSIRDGKNGKRGVAGIDGVFGKKGLIKFEKN